MFLPTFSIIVVLVVFLFFIGLSLDIFKHWMFDGVVSEGKGLLTTVSAVGCMVNVRCTFSCLLDEFVVLLAGTLDDKIVGVAEVPLKIPSHSFDLAILDLLSQFVIHVVELLLDLLLDLWLPHVLLYDVLHYLLLLPVSVILIPRTVFIFLTFLDDANIVGLLLDGVPESITSLIGDVLTNLLQVLVFFVLPRFNEAFLEFPVYIFSVGLGASVSPVDPTCRHLETFNLPHLVILNVEILS